MIMGHVSVLLNEVISGLNIQSGDTVLDCTMNGGGHSKYILEKYDRVRLVGIDADGVALDNAKKLLARFSDRVSFIEGNFRNATELLKKAGISSVDRALFDLGMSSNQLDSSLRGFSFLKDEPLLMTFKSNPSSDDLTAAKIVNSYSEDELGEIIMKYGEERNARKIVKAIVRARANRPLVSSRELAEIIKNALPGKFYSRIHPATKTFQALRIAVNDELNALSDGLKSVFSILNNKGRVAVISFHSLEDRIVKRYFSELAQSGTAVKITKKPICPSESEIKNNSRARSAKLRIVEKI